MPSSRDRLSRVRPSDTAPGRLISVRAMSLSALSLMADVWSFSGGVDFAAIDASVSSPYELLTGSVGERPEPPRDSSPRSVSGNGIFREPGVAQHSKECTRASSAGLQPCGDVILRRALSRSVDSDACPPRRDWTCSWLTTSLAGWTFRPLWAFPTPRGRPREPGRRPSWHGGGITHRRPARRQRSQSLIDPWPGDETCASLRTHFIYF